MKPSKFQKGIFRFCEGGKGSLVVQAVAGSGKTTTAILAVDHCDGESLFLAFNKVIAEELKGRGVNARTFHSACYSPVMKYLGIKTVDFDKLRKIMRQELSYDDNKAYGSLISKLVGLGKQAGVGVLCNEGMFGELFVEHDMSLQTYESDLNTLLALTKHIFNCSVNDTSSADFDDLLYYVVKFKLKLKTYDVIMVDEAQDTNAIQRAILKQMSHKNTRILAFGDSHQAIYRFRGSDSNAMDLLKAEFKCSELPLSISYRCPKTVVALAQKYNPAIEASPTAADGEVTELPAFDHTLFKSQDLVVCRTTRPLVSIAYKLMSRKVPVTILGRDIGQGLKALISRCKTLVEQDNLDFMMRSLFEYRNRELIKLKAQDKERQMEALQDKVETIHVLAQGLPYGSKVSDLEMVIDELFAEKKKAVIFSTIHKAKGLEAKRVFWLNHQECPAPWAKSPEDKVQELNLCYVAITRAKESLFLISEGGFR